ncbi:Hypothetical predicted protein [Mytilus galloprovincialis]|uniref:Reverse transcriptase domain-containing protein n=1 Tax=Mytilus galloprovincialis TaxID=29158 RepID=A0A8B6BPX5_MYTGA|nr:Hypothetical predicted protein [Mytilus galloprovincialis]
MGDFRLIQHLSYPENNSINDFIDKDHCSVQYSSVDEAACLINRHKTFARLSQCDVKAAFRLLPIAPHDFDLLGIKFQGEYYLNKMLPMGASISCALWEKFAKALHWIIQLKSGNDDILHYLDDFLFVESSQTSKVGNTLKLFQEVCNKIGIPLASDKTTLPTTLLMFLGIEFDTQNLIMRLPNEKLVKLSQKIRDTLDSSKITLKDMQSLLGLLNFACKVVAPGRTFCRRLINSTIGVRKSYYKIRVNKQMKADLEVWLDFLKQYKWCNCNNRQLGEVQKPSSRSRPVANQNSNTDLEHLSQVADYIVNQGVSKNTQKSYNLALSKLCTFRSSYKLKQDWPVPVNDLLNFIAFLSVQGLSGGTISSYISGVSYHHKIQGIQDTTKFFIIGKALEGIKRIQGGKRNDIRAPITVQLLSDMISCLDKVCKNKYEAALFSAVFSVAFFGLLRVGEITTTSKSKSVINGSNLTISDILVRRKVLELRFQKANKLKVFTGPKILWIVGSSLVHWANVEAKKYGRNNLGLGSKGVTTYWIGQPGLQIKEIWTPYWTQKEKFLPSPHFIIIHCGANDLTDLELTGKGLMENVKCSILRYKALFKNVIIIWSSMLQRRYWHFAPLNAGAIIEQKRKRVNSVVKNFVIENGGKAILHENIRASEVSLYRTDGTHLSQTGNQVFLNNIQGGLSLSYAQQNQLFQ